MTSVGRGLPTPHAASQREKRVAALKRSEAQGHAYAQSRLAGMLFNGSGGPEDAAEARRLLGLAAVQGDATAQS